MNWLLTTLAWYLPLFILGIIFFPLTKRLFAGFIDHGYAFSKTIAILILSYIVFVLGVLKILPFTQLSLLFLTGIFVLISFGVGWLSGRAPDTRSTSESTGGKDNEDRTRRIIFFEELLFLAALIFLAYIRGQEPSIHGLEKFMDFGFMNSILRSRYFPPLDMWYSGYPINYYYFGHITGALLIKLTGIIPSIGYNLILATIFAQAVTLTFSLTVNIINFLKKARFKILIFFGLLGSFIVNLGGNLHTIYLFTSSYQAETPIPFWQILSSYNPAHYWYPNATRFIPFTIHEFPSYSWVVADLHGHVFDIPFVILTLALLFIFFTNSKKILDSKFYILNSIILGFMIAAHYMTNAFDGPIYLLLAIIIYFWLFRLTKEFFIMTGGTIIFFLIFALPFSYNFSPFVSGIGVNCSSEFLVQLHKLGPFLFEKGNCQVSPFWMLFILWGFFWMSFTLFLIMKLINKKLLPFIMILFSFGTILVIIPEFFYIKDIYPAHFRANTMFKLGYQAFTMMGIASTVTLFMLRQLKHRFKYFLMVTFLGFFFFILLYPFYAFPSYYGDLKKTPQLDGEAWLNNDFQQDREIIDYINKNIKDQPIILEAQGDSYTDYERISAFTGLPTVAGWWVHEWLWRGSPEAVGKRIPEVADLYESDDIGRTSELIRKYGIKYIIVSGLEREKYKKLNESKFEIIGRKIFETSNRYGALYQTN